MKRSRPYDPLSKGGRPPRDGADGRRDRGPENGRRDSGKPHRQQDRPGIEPPRHGRVMLYGVHAVHEALRNPKRRIHRILAGENALQRLQDAGIAPGKAEILHVRPEELDRALGPDAVHQGIAIEAEPLPSPALEDLAPEGVVIVLDQVTDPHNVGAILRTAAAFAAKALVLTERHSPGATGVLAKAASGGLEHCPIIHVGNLAQALVKLGDLGFLRIGLDSEGPADLRDLAPEPPVALVLGAEGKGLRRLTRERCDALARLDMPGAIRSLNVSNAAALALFSVCKAR